MMELEPGRMRPATAERRPIWTALLPPLLAAGVLRVWGLAGQVVLGDELHPVRNVVLHDLRTILTSYRGADPCIPLTAFLEVATLAGFPVTEVLLRLPALLAGIATVVVLPWIVRPAVGRRRALLFAWFLALSPSLVFYSRIGRPYAVVALLGPCALAAFWRFWNGGGARWGALYAVVGAAAAWFHLLAAPAVAAPLAWAGAELVVHRVQGRSVPGRGRGLASLALVGVGLALGFAAFLVPAWTSFQAVVEQKVAGGRPGAGTLAGALVLQAGTPLPLLVAVFWALTLLGGAVLLRERPRLAVFGTVAVALQWLAVVVVLQPTGSEHVVVIERYALVVFPLVLLAAVAGLDRLWEGGAGGPARRWVSRGAAVAVAAGLVAGHPYLLDRALRLGPWAGSGTAKLFGTGPPPPALPGEHVPDAYRAVAATPGDSALVEVPTHAASWATRTQLALWRLHRRPVVLATIEDWLRSPEARRVLRFDTLVAARPEALGSTGARFIVLHRDRPRLVRIERTFIAGGEPAEIPPTRPAHPAVRAGRTLTRELRELWGEAHLADGQVLLWDLARVPAARLPARSVHRFSTTSCAAGGPLPGPPCRGAAVAEGWRDSGALRASMGGGTAPAPRRGAAGPAADLAHRERRDDDARDDR